MRHHTAIAMFLLVFGVAAPAPAQNDGQDDGQNADALNQEGLEAFSAGDFELAAEKFAAAYETEPDPIFRKSEAVAWFKADRCEPAIRAANAFLLQWEEGGEEVAQAESVVANCKIELAEDAMESESFELSERLLFEAEEHAQDQYTRDRISTTRVELARARRQALADEKATDRDSDSSKKDENDDGETGATDNTGDTGDGAAAEAEPAEGERSSPIGPVGVFGGGAMIVAAAVWHTVTLLSTVPRLQREADGGDPDKHARLARGVDTARWAVPALYVAGATTMGVGAWFWFKKTTEETPATREAEAGVSFYWRF